MPLSSCLYTWKAEVYSHGDFIRRLLSSLPHAIAFCHEPTFPHRPPYTTPQRGFVNSSEKLTESYSFALHGIMKLLANGLIPSADRGYIAQP